MMRPIKFRAYDKKNHAIVYGCIIDEHGNAYDSSYAYCDGIEPIQGTIMQYTGLKANGVEIYEGDIVTFNNILAAPPERSLIKAEIVFYEERAQFIPQEMEENHRGGRYIHQWDCCLDLEVIGNIYEQD